ncbi:MFS general substrate transporter [Guyanagaster necrorhizus]|uniref:MFS general substrate transporter n=1 Tax=Guyanagaster necrorhizus TaxID=856835 RepID=A0A9P7VPP0_9AGAR|nr:MFS general substrate transporter [Guyanagaster necrorhizus MCA 3950]KAG7445108.1 MFS general substrate transporter [Guyanagaster necrorhizus MCA 3950]
MSPPPSSRLMSPSDYSIAASANDAGDRQLALSPTVTHLGDEEPDKRIPSQDDELDAEKQRAQAVPQFPEGSFRGWATVCGGAFVGMCTFGNVQSFGVYQEYYTTTSLSEHSSSQISWIGSVQLCLLFSLGLLSGKLFDQGYFHHLLLGGSLLFLFSSFMLSLTQPHQFYQTLLSQGFGMGLGMGCMFIPSMSVLSHYFRVKRAVAMGFVVSGGALGAIIYPILLNKVFDKTGLRFPWAVRFVAFIDLFLLTLANLLMRPRLPPRKRAPIDIYKILYDFPYWLTVTGITLGFWGLFIPFFYLQVFAELHGVNPSFLTWTLPVLNAGSLFGRFIPNLLADRYGPFTVIIPSGFITGSLVWALLGVHTIAGMAVFGVLYGFFSGAFLTVATPAIASFTRSPTLDDIGLRIGISCFFIGLGLLTGSPIAGALLSPEYIWWRPLLFACVVIISGTICLAVARQYLVQRKGGMRFV